MAPTTDWWRDAVIYQVYIRSFADGDGDGLGDIAGIRSRLRYLADLGVDAHLDQPVVPLADGRRRLRRRGLPRHRAAVRHAGRRRGADRARRTSAGLRVLLDIVPNHTSDRHAWFAEALAAGPGSPARDRYMFRPGRGRRRRELPPNDWQSVFGGPAWERVTEPDGTPGEWYLHLFAPEQPDLNWEHPEVRAEFEETLRFWFDRGVDGFRIDVAHWLVKQDGLPDADDLEWPRQPVEVDGELRRAPWQPHPFWDRDEVHEIYRGWRAVADSYDPTRVFVAEAWVDEPERLARYLRPDELHTAFNFAYLQAPWDAGYLRHVIAETLDELGAVGAPATWVLSNHDVARHVSRYAREQDGARQQPDAAARPAGRPGRWAGGGPAPRRCSRSRCPAAPTSTRARSSACPRSRTCPTTCSQDPTWERSGHTDRGRDGCRVPLPWSGAAPPYGFSPEGATRQPWLPQPADWARPHRRGAGRRPGLDARALPRRAAAAARDARRSATAR